MRRKYQQIFHPRAIRAALKGAHAQAEAATGTHLYAYLQDADIPEAVVDRAGASPGCSRTTSESSKAVELQRQLQNLTCPSANTKTTTTTSGFGSGFRRRSQGSLLQQIKTTKEVFNAAFRWTHDTISNQLKSIGVSSEDSLGASRGGLELQCGVENIAAPSVDGMTLNVTMLDECAARNISLRVFKGVSATSAATATRVDTAAHEIRRRKITVNEAILSALVVCRDASTADLLITCHSLTDNFCAPPTAENETSDHTCSTSHLQTNSQSKGHKHGDHTGRIRKVHYAARVALTSQSEERSVLNSQLPRCIKWYVAEVSETAIGDSLFGESDSNRDDDDIDVENRDDDEDDDDDEGKDQKSRAVAIVGIGASKVNSSTDTESGARSCLFRIDLETVVFSEICVEGGNVVKADEIIEQLPLQSLHASGGNADDDDDDNDDQDEKRVGNHVSVRQRYIQLDSSEADSVVDLVACASRGLVLVSVTPRLGDVGGKVVVVDLEADEEDDDDDEEEDDSNGGDDAGNNNNSDVMDD